MTYHIVGLDLSLSSTGVAIVRTDDTIPTVRTVTSKPVPNAKYPHTLARLRMLARQILAAARAGREDGDTMIVAVEGPSYGSGDGQQGHHVRAGLWWLMFHLLEKEALYVVIPPATLKKYVTGKGNAPKDLVLTSIVRAHPHVGVTDNNEADALGLAAMVARHLGHPIEVSAQRVGAGAALDAVDWPDEIRRP